MSLDEQILHVIEEAGGHWVDSSVIALKLRRRFWDGIAQSLIRMRDEGRIERHPFKTWLWRVRINTEPQKVH